MSMNTNKPLIKMHVWHNGDPSVGIAGESADITFNNFDHDTESEILIHAKKVIEDAFEKIWGEGKVFTATEDEAAWRIEEDANRAWPDHLAEALNSGDGTYKP